MSDELQPPLEIPEILRKADTILEGLGAPPLSQWYEAENKRRVEFEHDWQYATLALDGLDEPLIPGYWYDVTLKARWRDVSDKTLRNCLYQRRHMNWGGHSYSLLFQQWGAKPTWEGRTQPVNPTSVVLLKDLGGEPAVVAKAKAAIEAERARRLAPKEG